MSGIYQSALSYVFSIPETLSPQFEEIKTYVCDNPLVNRVTANWRVTLMDVSTAIAVGGVFVAFIYGSTLLWVSFTVMAISLGVSAFYMRRFEELKSFEATANSLRDTQGRLEANVTTLQAENTRLAQTNALLHRTSEEIQATNQELRNTHAQLEESNRTFRANNETLTNQLAGLNVQNAQLDESNRAFRANNEMLTNQVAGLNASNQVLTNQVGELTLQVTQLRSSAERIKTEMEKLYQTNTHLDANTQNFDQSLLVLNQHIVASQELCDTIAESFSSQQQGLGEQLRRFEVKLNELVSDGAVHQRIQSLATLRKEMEDTAQQLHRLQVEFAAERGKFEALSEAMEKVRAHFESSVNEAVAQMAINNQEFANNNLELSEYMERVRKVLNIFPQYQGLPPQGAPFPMQTGRPTVFV